MQLIRDVVVFLLLMLALVLVVSEIFVAHYIRRRLKERLRKSKP